MPLSFRSPHNPLNGPIIIEINSIHTCRPSIASAIRQVSTVVCKIGAAFEIEHCRVDGGGARQGIHDNPLILPGPCS